MSPEETPPPAASAPIPAPEATPPKSLADDYLAGDESAMDKMIGSIRGTEAAPATPAEPKTEEPSSG